MPPRGALTGPVDPKLRSRLIGLGAYLLAIWIGMSVAQQDYSWAIVSMVASVWLLLAWLRHSWSEAGILAFLFFCYIIGNRGFAQVTPISGLPLFFGELGLGFSLLMVIFRASKRSELPVPRNWLNGVLLLLLAFGCGRIVFDVRSYGFVALRDFATLYYALFFFVTQAVCRQPQSRQEISHAFLVTFAFLPVTSLATFLFPNFFQRDFVYKGIPLVLYKGDLQATSLFTGFIFLLPSGPWKGSTQRWRWLAALGSLVFGLTMTSRSGMMGLAVAICWLAWSGRWRPLQVLAVTCMLGLFSLTIYSTMQQKSFTQTKAYAVYEAVVSITDFSGTRNYQNEMTSDKGDNNQFRLVWWKNVAEETLRSSPLLGLGFGADIARGFLQEYFPTGEVDFTARSPHNIFVTLLGRMGFTGLTLFLTLYFTVARHTAHAARMARRDPGWDNTMTLYAACWVIMVSACFGVVLEGPMGAIPFWIMLGLAHYKATNSEA